MPRPCRWSLFLQRSSPQRRASTPLRRRRSWMLRAASMRWSRRTASLLRSPNGSRAPRSSRRACRTSSRCHGFGHRRHKDRGTNASNGGSRPHATIRRRRARWTAHVVPRSRQRRHVALVRRRQLKTAQAIGWRWRAKASSRRRRRLRQGRPGAAGQESSSAGRPLGAESGRIRRPWFRCGSPVVLGRRSSGSSRRARTRCPGSPRLPMPQASAQTSMRSSGASRGSPSRRPVAAWCSMRSRRLR
mmetsp:Transcript_104015/g.300894  ORF Transcript_104015/g.300894 Transcript_104015/m.300894 type:complete len:245 (+) Transcript_104015:215-949(+)